MLCVPGVAFAGEQPLDPAAATDPRDMYDTEQLVEEAHQLTAADLAPLKARAEAGEARAQVMLGLVYEFGTAGTTAPPGEALSWFMKAAAQGVAWAEAWAADFYFNGSAGTERDLARAIALYTSAANHGDSRAAFFVGQMYFYGDAVPAHPREAAAWFRRANPAESDLVARMVELAEAPCDSTFCLSLRQVMGAVMTGSANRFVDSWSDTAREWNASIALPGTARCGLTSSDHTSSGDVQNYFCDSAPVDDEPRGIELAKQLADQVQKALPAGYTRTERDTPRSGPSTFFARDGYPHLRVTFNLTPGSAQHRVTLLVGP
jgi:hypothetical protein